MTAGTPALIAALLASALVAACATPAADTAEVRPERVYRTGSNIPVKEAGPDGVKTYKPDESPPPRTMPMPRPGGGG
jgi:hypothetical protein